MRLLVTRTATDVWVRLEGETTEEMVALERSATRELARRLGYPARITEERTAPVPPPRLVIVQRGEVDLAERLRAIARPGVPVIWDRRERDRRTVSRPVPLNRRQGDRRRPPPVTWRTLRFLVVHATDQPEYHPER